MHQQGRSTPTYQLPAEDIEQGLIHHPTDIQLTRRLKSTRTTTRAGQAKKQKRYSPYDKGCVASDHLDEIHLQETPVLAVDEALHRALVAGPQQPPSHK